MRLLDDRGRQRHVYAAGEALTVALDVRTAAPLEDFVFGVGLFSADGVSVYGTNTEIESFVPRAASGDGQVSLSFDDLRLVEGTYLLDVAAHRRDGTPYDYHRGLYSFRIKSRVKDVGVYRPAHRWSFGGGLEESARRMDLDLEAERAEFAMLVNGIGEETGIEVNQRIVMLLQQIARQHTSKPLRILQVGPGNGALTEHVSQALEGYDAEYISMETVEEEYRAQGLAPNSFDVVFAAGAIDSSDMGKLKELICPGGWLILAKWTEPSWISELQKEEDGLVFVLQNEGESHLLAHRVKLDRVRVSGAELEKFLSLHLPAYMLPAHLQVVDALPLTGNGKIDRRELAKWRLASSFGQNAATDATEVAESDPLEAQLAHVWAEALGVSRIGRTQSFYEYGADSLIMAQVAGKLRDKLAEDSRHAAIPFDILLRQMLNFPTVEALAGFIHMRNQEMQQSEEVAFLKKRNKSSNAVLIPYGGDESGPLRVVFHAVLGTMDSFRPLIEQLKAQQTGSIVGIAIDDSERYCELEPSELIETVADDYAEPHRGHQYEGRAPEHPA